MDKNQYCILIVEAEKLISKTLAKHFVNEYRIYEASNPTEAFQLIKSENIDMVIAHSELPGIGSIEFLLELKKHYPHIVRLVISDQHSVSFLANAINTVGINAMLSKNDKITETIKIIKNCIDNSVNNKKFESGSESNIEQLKQELADAKIQVEILDSKYQSLFNNLRNGFATHEIIKDSSGKAIDYRFLEVNSVFEQLTGLKASEIIGKTCLQVLPGTESYWIDTYARIAETGESLTFDNYSSQLDKYYQVTAYSNEKEKFSVVFVDITDRKLIEQSLSESEEKFRSLFDNHSAIKLLIDPSNGKITDANHAAELYYGWSKQELLNLKISDINILSEEEIIEKINQIKQDEQKHFEFKHKHKDGSISDVEVFASKIKVGSKTYLHSIIHDITDRIKAEKELKFSEEKFSAAFKSSPYLILITSLNDGIILDVNDRVFEHTGYTYDEFVGKTTTQLSYWVNPEDRVEFMNRFANDGFVRDMEVKLRKKNAEIRYNLISAEIIKVQDKTYALGVNRDITEQKLTEQSLREAKDYLDEIINAVGSPLFVKDQDSKYFLVNDAFCNLMNFSRNEIIGSNGEGFFQTEQNNQFIEDDQKVIASGIENINEEVLTDGSGYVRTIITRNTRYIDALGKKYIVGVINDITDRKKSEEENRKTQELFHSIFEQSPFGIALVDTSTGLSLQANKSFCKITGRTQEQLLATDWMSFTHPDDIESDLRLMNELIKSEINSYNIKKRYIRPDNTTVWVRMSVVSIRIEENELPRHLCLVEDISEQIKAEEALADSELNFRSLFEKGPIAIAYHKMIYDNMGKPVDYYFIEANQSYQELTGVNPVGKLVTEAFPGIENDPFDWIGKFGEVAKTGKEIRFQQYLEANKRWYDCVSYQYKPDHFVAAFLEITNQKKAEKELQESQALYHSFVEHIPGAVFRKDKEGKYIFVNSVFCEMKGMSSDEIIGKTPLELSKYEENKIFDNSITHSFRQRTIVEGDNHHKYIMRTGKSIELEEVYQLPDGSKKYYQIVKSPVFGINAKVIGSQGIQLDITSRKLAEMALIEKDRQQATLISNLPGFVYRCTFDEHWTMKFISDGCIGITGYKPEDFIENKKISFAQIISPKYSKEIWERWNMVIPKDEAFTEEYEITNASGEKRWIWEQGRAVRDNIGNILYLEGFITDITNRKKTEASLKISELKFRTLFSEMSEMVALYKLKYSNHGIITDYWITECNESFQKTAGIQYENIVGKLGSDIFRSTPPPYIANLIEAKKTGKTIEFKTYSERNDKFLHISVVPLYDDTFAVIMNDVTEITKYNNILLEKNKELESYVYVTSHDLRSPLVNIQGFSARLKKQTDLIANIISESNLPSDKKNIVEESFKQKIPITLDYIFNNVSKMEKMLNGLLQISRTGRLDMNIQYVDVNKLLNQIVQSIDFQAKEKNATIVIDELPGCYGDENLLNQLFSNIIINALKYQHPNRKTEIKINAEKTYKKVIYAVHDNGIGISTEHLEKIWNVFYRIDNTETQGEGIGLSVVKRIIEKHKGKIWVRSIENLGSTFYFELHTENFSE